MHPYGHLYMTSIYQKSIKGQYVDNLILIIFLVIEVIYDPHYISLQKLFAHQLANRSIEIKDYYLYNYIIQRYPCSSVDHIYRLIYLLDIIARDHSDSVEQFSKTIISLNAFVAFSTILYNQAVHSTLNCPSAGLIYLNDCEQYP